MSLSIYKGFQGSFWPGSIRGKIIVISFLGIHAPLIGLILYLFSTELSLTKNLDILIVTLISTLIGTGATLWIISGLLKPIEFTAQAVSNYATNQKEPDLPTNFNDEMGLLMANVQRCITKLSKLIALKNDIVSIISHDLKSPVTSVLMGTELLKEDLTKSDSLSEEISFNLDIIKKSAHQQKRILNDLLQTAKLGSTELELNTEPFTLKELFVDIKSNHLPQAESKGINLITTAGKWSEETVELDRIKITEILSNLVNNAIKFTPQHGEVKLSVKKITNHIIFKVRDNGTGIKKEKIDQIFERKYTTRSPYQKTKGTGLGLWICRQFTELHNGTISVESDRNKGTTFTVKIPLH